MSVADLRDFDGEPRVRDVRIGELAGLSRPRDIRPVAANNADELRRYGVMRVRPAELRTSHGAVHTVQEQWYNEGQALLLLTKLNTDAAADARQEMITVFMAWRRGELHPKAAPASDNAALIALLDASEKRSAAVMERIGVMMVEGFERLGKLPISAG